MKRLRQARTAYELKEVQAHAAAEKRAGTKVTWIDPPDFYREDDYETDSDAEAEDNQTEPEAVSEPEVAPVETVSVEPEPESDPAEIETPKIAQRTQFIPPTPGKSPIPIGIGLPKCITEVGYVARNTIVERELNRLNEALHPESEESAL